MRRIALVNAKVMARAGRVVFQGRLTFYFVWRLLKELVRPSLEHAFGTAGLAGVFSS